jgi:KipI family sensor histidine kinase inhibitor
MAGPRYLPAGEAALVVEFGATADPAFHVQVLALDIALSAAKIDGVTESVPTYRSLMIHFDPHRLDHEKLQAQLAGLVAGAVPPRQARRWRIPACYEAPHGEDLAEVAAALGRPAAEIAALHAQARYEVVMYGFAPGFVFLSGLPEALRLSRRATPRPPAAPGALTIANGQALIASIAMPTGWYVLGRTPIRTFDVGRDPAFPIGIGDEVRFEPIDAATFDRLARETEAGAPLQPVS